MKKFYLTITLLLCSLFLFAQQYFCEKLSQDIDMWNSIKNKDNIKWANAIKDKELYKQNADGSLEYTYILNSTDSTDIATLRNIGFNYIGYYFNVDNATRADMVTNSPSDGVIFKGKLIGIGSFFGMFDFNKINCDIIFDIRFKAKKIRFSVRIEEYQIIKITNGIITQNYKAYVKNCYPLNPNSDHKKSFAMSFINANSNCINYAQKFVDYVNRNIKKEQLTIKEDSW